MAKASGTPERFWERVNKDGPVPIYESELGPCWLWTAYVNQYGYGVFYWGSRPERAQAHRHSYELARGPVPDGLVLDHLCRVRHCVNPAHLEAVTNGDNLRRGFGVTGINSRKTHCKYGHEFDETNTYLPPSGGRQCRICNARVERERRARLSDARRLSR